MCYWRLGKCIWHHWAGNGLEINRSTLIRFSSLSPLQSLSAVSLNLPAGQTPLRPDRILQVEYYAINFGPTITINNRYGRRTRNVILEGSPAPLAFQLAIPCYKTEEQACRKSSLAGTFFYSSIEKNILSLATNEYISYSNWNKQKSLDSTLSVLYLHYQKHWFSMAGQILSDGKVPFLKLKLHVLLLFPTESKV